MKLKLDAEGRAILQDGNPVYIHDDGKEAAVDVAGLFTSVKARSEQSQRVETENKDLKAKVKLFEGIEDPAAAIKALGIIANLDAKKLVDSGEVQKVKDEAIKAVRGEYEPIVAERDSLKAALFGEKIGGSFARSKVIADKFAIPADLVQARFGSNFKIEDGKTVAYDGQGNKIFSRTKPGELADFEEALETLVDQYPYKNQILKGANASGGGANGGGQGGGGQKTLTRAQLEAIPPAGRRDALKGATLVD